MGSESGETNAKGAVPAAIDTMKLPTALKAYLEIQPPSPEAVEAAVGDQQPLAIPDVDLALHPSREVPVA